MANAIEISGLNKTFGVFSLRDIDLEIPKGYIVGMIGENGAGKSTLIKSITGAVIPDSGTVRISDGDRGDMGIVFDDCHLPMNLNVDQIGGIMSGMFPSWDQDTYDRLVLGYGLDRTKKLSTFSRGMKMKMQVAVALSHDPKTLILDEPTAGMDPAARDEFLDLIMEYIQDEGHTVLISSHITTDLERIADYIVFMHKGRLVLSDEKDSILERYGLVRCGKDAFDALDRDTIVTSRSNDMGVTALTTDKHGMREAYPELVVDDATLDDILVMIVRGDGA